MKRRDFITLLGGATALALQSFSALAQRANIPRVGYLFPFTRAESQDLWQACRQGLRELGHSEGQSVLLEPRWAEPVLGLPAALPPEDEPWLYDGRIVLRARPRSGRQGA